MTSGVSASIGLSPATQVQAEAAVSNSVALTPLNAKWHPAIAKAWVEGSSGGGISSSHNVSSVTNNSTGNCTVTLTTPFSGNSFACVASGVGSGGAMTSASSSDASNVAVLTYNTAGSLTDGTFSLVCFGDQ